MCCYYKVNRDFELDEAIPVGRPFKNTEIILLDENNKRAADGEPGEICIRGTSLTMGYYNNPEKTAEAFVQNPLNTAYPELIYRTGDIGKYNQYGELVFVSRKDYQIKHMGHRIELGEIEVNVNMLEEIKLSGCIYDTEKGKIVLYYVGDMETGELTKILRDKLPRYMIPNYVEKLEEMPLTPNGKINRVFLKEKYNLEEVFCENSLITQKGLRGYVERHNILEYKCQFCGCDGHWLDTEISLEIDHINGINNDNPESFKISMSKLSCNN